MSKAKSYKIKSGTSAEDLKRIQGIKDNKSRLIKTNCDLLISKYFVMPRNNFRFIIYVVFDSQNPNEFNDFDNVEVLDDDFLQPYFPFYDESYYKKDGAKFPVLDYCIEKYNEFMDSIPVLEVVE